MNYCENYAYTNHFQKRFHISDFILAHQRYAFWVIIDMIFSFDFFLPIDCVSIRQV